MDLMSVQTAVQMCMCMCNHVCTDLWTGRWGSSPAVLPTDEPSDCALAKVENACLYPRLCMPVRL